MTFLVLFMAMFYSGWPIAVRISGWLIPETAADQQRAEDAAEGLRVAGREQARLAGREKARRSERG
jgi:hypothetical protein